MNVKSKIKKAIDATEIAFSYKFRNNKIFEKAKVQIDEVFGLLNSWKLGLNSQDELKAFSEVRERERYLQTYQAALDSDEDKKLKEYFSKLILPFTSGSKFCDYCYRKPRGYPGDFVMMDMIWKGRLEPAKNRYLGVNDLGKLINAYTLDLDICEANILRTKAFTDFLCGKKFVDLASIGSGSVIELTELAKVRSLANANISLFDLDEGALDISVKKIEPFFNSVNRVQGNIIKTVLKAKEDSFDVIYSSGLFDYFSVEACNRILKKLWFCLRSGGSIMISNVHAENPSRFWMEYVGDWYLINKTKNDMLNMTKGLENIKMGHYDIDGYNCYQYIIFTKC
ncbi:methyltransferase domain-containing protein [Candidatus Margulisiibacteriota bacterium]